MATDGTRRPQDFFDRAYEDTAPWEIGRAQPDLVRLLDEIEPVGPILEVGSGSGDLALELAERGLVVIGVDSSPVAVERAQERATGVKPGLGSVEFRVADAFHLSQIPDPIATVVDSGFYHLFGADERREFAQELATKLPSDGRYYLLGFAFDSPVPGAPREVAAEELHNLFSADQGWRVLKLGPAQFVTSRGNVPAIAACFERV
jgi:SAM-dependent methyltransferase